MFSSCKNSHRTTYFESNWKLQIYIYSLSVVLVILSNSQTCSLVASNQNSEDDNLETSINTNDNHETNVAEKNNNQIDESKFTWINHPDDHGVYRGRSLISEQNVRHQVKIPEERSTDHFDDDETGALKTKDFAEKEWQLMFRSFDIMFDSVASSSIIQMIGKHTNIFEDVLNRLPAKCARDIRHIRDSFKRHKMWAMRMVDSMGKFPSGITYGRFSSQGDFEECLAIDVDETLQHKATTEGSSKPLVSERYKFKGKYCLIDFRLPLPDRPRDKMLSIHDPVIDLSKTDLARDFPDMANYSGYASVFYETGYMHAFCVPNSCRVEDLTKSIGITLEGIHIIVNNTLDCQELGPEPLRKSQIISITLLSFIFLNAFYATYCFYQAKKRKMAILKDKSIQPIDAINVKTTANNKFIQLLRSDFYIDCFSIQRNFERLTKPDPRGLTFVHYTRIVAMGLTVITHTAAMGTLQAITKPADASNSESLFRDLLPQMLANAFTSIQIFFFMAGFMLVVSTYPSIKRERGHLPFFEYSIKRAIRLLPGIFATICINFLWPLFVHGPNVSYFVRMIVEPCEKNWWRTMTFLSNFDHVEKLCIRHSYFSASDYQLHLMAFPLLVMLYKQPTISLYIAGLLTVAGFVIQVIMVLTKLVMPFLMVDYIDKETFFNIVHYIHHPVWNHMSAFFYGFIIGYMVVKQIRVNWSPKTIKRIWLIIVPLGILSIFAPYFWNHYRRPIYRWQMVLYIIIDRSILLTTCAWISYGTMVLGRPAPKKNTNEQSIDTKKQSDVTIELNTTTANARREAPPVIGPNNNESNDFIRKQLSSPNLSDINYHNQATDYSKSLRPAQSSSNVDKLGDSSENKNNDQKFVSSPTKKISPNDKKIHEDNETMKPTPRRQAPVSNVNTLCLVFSRLTFQLYLFNMVVLWIDVQHSKYNWFFSYYFIIVKSLAIYIMSSIMATIFFIVLESPALTLYILWVKSAAVKRAKARAESDKKRAEEEANNRQLLPVISLFEINNKNNNKNNQLDCKEASIDGLCMNVGAGGTGAKKSVSLISLSTASNSPPNGEHQRSTIQQSRL